MGEGSLPRVAAKKIVHMDFPTLLMVNKEVVALTQESSSHTEADDPKLRELLADVESASAGRGPDDALPEKASLLIFKIASGQHFKAGNKRTALVAGFAFLRKNGYNLDIEDGDLVSVVDRVGIAAATLEDLQKLVLRLAVKAKAERKGWESLVTQSVESKTDFLTRISS